MYFLAMRSEWKLGEGPMYHLRETFSQEIKARVSTKVRKCGPQETFISRSWIPHEAECNPALDSVFDGIRN